MDLSSFTPDQRKAVQHLDGPLLVCAGAGTGKTFTLTQRIAWALVGNPQEGIPPFLDSIDQALVITFTNKAAAELKGRFRATLRAVGRFEDALKVDGAWVSTIHGMCSRILREHALELGMDPEFKLAIGAVSQEALMRAIEESIRDVEDYDAFQPLFAEYETYGVKQMVQVVIGEAACQTRGLDAFDLGPGPSDTGILLRTAVSLAEDIAAAGKGKTAERAALAVEKLTEYQMAGANAQELPDIVASLELGRMRGEGVAELKSAIAALQDAENLNRAWDLMELLMRLARKVQANYQAILHEQGLVDTSDLIRKTLAAFDEHPEIAEQYTKRFKLIMVDEFQDTSQLQVDMIERIAGPGKPHLCTVGDSQQSIYRFQGADVGVYLKHKQDMKDAGALSVELRDNFRSNPDILAFVRAVCGRAGYFVEDFLDLRAGSTGRRYVGSAPRVELAVTLYENGCSDDAATEEARLIARRFRTLLDEGHSPSDMVVLMGATTKMETYAQALRDQGIPCMASGGSKYYASAHVKRCLSLLNVLANPFDSESMMDILCSDVLPVSSCDLLRLATYRNQESDQLMRQNFAHAFLYADRLPENTSPLLQHAINVLQRAWSKLGTVRPAKLFLETAIDSGWLDRLATQGEQGQAVTADIMKMVRLLEDAQKEAGFDMARVAGALHAAAESDSEAPGVLSVEGLQAVRLMTVHSSKGLEFPIVAVTSCFTSRTDSGALRTVTDNGTVHASLMPKGTKLGFEPDFDESVNLGFSASLAEQRAKIVEVDRQRAEAERRRLFYVAATRATDALIVAMNKRLTKNLVYREIEADLLQALFPGQDDFPAASGPFEYGGSQPGVFTRMEIHKHEDAIKAKPDSADAEKASARERADASEETLDNDKTCCASFGDSASDDAADAIEQPVILVPNLESPVDLHLRCISSRDDFFSYSSIAHHGASDPQKTDPQAALQDENQHESQQATIAKPLATPGQHAAGIVSDPLDELAPATPLPDADKATDFGSALHRTCEWIALRLAAAKRADAQVACPQEVGISPKDIQSTAMRFAGTYDVRDTKRLESAVSRWLQSDIAERAYRHASCQPEVPFCTHVAGEFLEGEIDLLCHDRDDHAFIVDYKTGGSDGETARQLQAKHQLQAQCYAYATLVSGFQSVELHFVRVERPCSADDDNPQVVSYSYCAKDLPILAETIETARAAESQSK